MKISNVRWQRVSLAARVSILVGVTFVCCVLLLGVFVQNSISRHFMAQDLEEFRVITGSVNRALLGDGGGGPVDSLEERLDHAVAGHHGVFFSVYDADGKEVYAMPGPDFESLVSAFPDFEHTDIDRIHQWSQGDSTYRGTVVGANSDAKSPYNGYKIVVASSMNFHLTFIDKFRAKLWGILGCASVMILLIAWFVVQFAHRPLHRISQDIENITTERLNQRLELDSIPADLRELATSFNRMIGRIDDVFQRLSNFSADIAHELRTPITNLTTQTQVALSKERQPDEYREVLYSSLEEYERMASMVNDMLWLAQSDNGMLKPNFEPVDPAVQVLELFDYLSAWAEDRHISLSLQGSCPSVQGDKAMLRRALTNLLTNAIHHTEAGTEICVRLDSDEEHIHIAIENQGDNIPSELLPQIFARFYRVDPSRQRGNSGGRSGLGLAIVHSIVDIHGGEIEVTSENQKTVFTITLPLTSYT